MDLRVGMNGLAIAILGLSALWFGLGMFIVVVLWVQEFFGAGTPTAAMSPGGYVAWTFVMPALFGIILALVLRSVGTGSRV